MKKALALLFVSFFASTLYAQELPVTKLGPDLMGVVESDQWYSSGSSYLDYDLENRGFKFTTDADGNSNHDGWENSIGCGETIKLEANRGYQFVFRMKADIFPRGQNINVILMDTQHKDENGYVKYKSEITWNVSKAGEWEKVYFSIFPSETAPWMVSNVFVNQTLKYLLTPSTIYFSPDVDVFELPAGTEVANMDPIDITTDKDVFASSNLKIDALGNVYTHQEDDTWKHVFPKLMYKGYNGGATISTVNTRYKRYKDYGFTGVMDVWTGTEAQAVIDAGMEHISIDANYKDETEMEYYVNSVNNWAKNNDRHDNVLWYNYDNENDQIPRYDFTQYMMTFINNNFVDPQTNQRRHPLYFLNGNWGLCRTYHNNSVSVMDITGSYVGGLAAVGETSSLSPLPSLLTQFKTQNQRAPIVVIQLQSYLHYSFVPALFHGIIMGGKALSVWRDGTTFGGSNDDFRENVWADVFKNDVSPKLDLMLPLIEQSHFTSWKASTDYFPDVRIGTRDLNGESYLILTNYATTDIPITVTLNGLQATEAVDMFTEEQIAIISNNQFQFTMGHHHQGYRVIQLKKTGAEGNPHAPKSSRVTKGCFLFCKS